MIYKDFSRYPLSSLLFSMQNPPAGHKGKRYNWTNPFPLQRPAALLSNDEDFRSFWGSKAKELTAIIKCPSAARRNNCVTRSCSTVCQQVGLCIPYIGETSVLCWTNAMKTRSTEDGPRNRLCGIEIIEQPPAITVSGWPHWGINGNTRCWDTANVRASVRTLLSGVGFHKWPASLEAVGLV